MRWALTVKLDPTTGVPLYLQIARALADEIERGRLREGDALPGSRALAKSLHVHRNTVVAAYDELNAEGWLKTESSRGTFIARPPGANRAHPSGRGLSATVGYPLRQAAPLRATARPPAGTLDLVGSAPDARLIPTAALARAYRRVLLRNPKALLPDGEPAGAIELRRAIATMVGAVRGIPAGPRSILITRGTQMALELSARVLLSPGDVVAVEALGFPRAWDALRSSGARLLPIPVDERGLRVDALETALGAQPIRALYVTSHNQFPTTVLLAPDRRVRLLELARQHRFAILEDDYDHEFRFGGEPVLPLASRDETGSVIYLGTLTRILAFGLRLGYVIAPTPVLEQMIAARATLDWQGDQVVECAVAEMFDDGEIQRNVLRLRHAYHNRRDAFAQALRAELGGAVRFDVPEAGMALWAEVAPDIDLDGWIARGGEAGVRFYPGKQFHFDGSPIARVRLGYGILDEKELREAAARMARALAAAGRSGPA